MKKHLLIGIIVLFCGISFAQPVSPRPKAPEFSLEKARVEAQLRFLASDEMRGRRTGTPYNNIAARYIAETFRQYGVQPAAGNDYFQVIPFVIKTPPQRARFQLTDTPYELGENLVMLSGDAAELDTRAVFVNHGWVDAENGIDDYAGKRVEGKIVVALSGLADDSSPFGAFSAMAKKRDLAAQHGAVALIELYQFKFPWNYFKRFMNKERLTVEKEAANPAAKSLPYGWFNESNKELISALTQSKKGMKAKLVSTGVPTTPAPSANVAGVIPGADPDLREEFVVLSAHFDHIGTGQEAGGRYTEQDSIFNGARDNGMGTVALLSAAKTLSEKPPRRSVLLLAVTGEELGLLGSAYYAEHPLIPLEKTIFNLNTDGAGYDDVSAVSPIGFGRTDADRAIETAAKAFGLNLLPNPAPEQNLFDRSDNVNFAQAGVPALCLSPGTTGFSDEIKKHYHQASDNPETIDFDYMLRYCQVFAHAARLIADMDAAPFWHEGDKYEAAGKALYKKP